MIAAVDLNGGIGFDGELLHTNKEDMTHFRKTTEGQIVIMGKNTFKSLNYIPLVSRINIVVSSSLNPELFDRRHLFIVKTVDEALKLAAFMKQPKGVLVEKSIFIIGGAMLYSKMIKFADHLIITSFRHDFPQADTFFPHICKDRFKIATTRMVAKDTVINYYNQVNEV